jgi:hypothetical protein
LWVVVLVVDGTYGTIPTVGILWGRSFLFPPGPIAVKLLTKGIAYMAWKWSRISLESWMVSWYKNEIIQASVLNCMRQCLNFLVLNIHIPAYMGSRGKPFFQNFEVFLLCLPIVDQYKFVYNNLYCLKGK